MTTCAPELPQRNNSTSLRRALRVLDAVSDYRGRPSGISLTCLAASLDMSKSTVLRLIAPFRDEGLIHQDRDSGRYRLGPAAARLGAAFVERLDVEVLAADLLRDLSRRTGEPAVLVMVDNAGPGVRTAGDVVLTALGPPSDAAGPAVTNRTATAVQERGWWIERQGAGAAGGTVAAPVFDHLSRVVAAVQSPLPRPARICPVGEAVRECAAALSERLGAPRRGSGLQNSSVR